MSQVRTHYDNLQVKETASDEVIKGAYRYLSQKWHPDRNPHNEQEAERILKVINQAYAVLSDPIKRKEHDEWIRMQKEGESEPAKSQSPPYTEQRGGEGYAAASAKVIRPWVRLWARTLDTCVFGIVFGIAIGVAYPQAFAGKPNEQLFGMIILFAWVFVESIFLSQMGTTPGKWLLKTKIEHRSGRISFDVALSRSFKVWWRGMGIGFPFAALITQIVAYNRLTKSGETTWDADEKFTVTHENIGAVRVIVAVFISLVVLLFVSAGGT
jgi:curved DNA-binding protein CbpA